MQRIPHNPAQRSACEIPILALSRIDGVLLEGIEHAIQQQSEWLSHPLP